MLPLALLVPSAWPCAGLITPDATESLAGSDAQQAILEIHPDAVSAEFRVRYSGNAEDFAWIIPVPGPVIAVDAGSEERFTAIEAATAPQVDYYSSASDEEEAAGCACGEQDYALGGDSFGARGGLQGDPSGVSIVATGFAGAFDYTVLQAAPAEDILSWLEGEGYDTSVSAPSIEAYADDPLGFYWVAVELRPDVATTPDGGVVLDPLRITWGASTDGALHASYPARMALTSMLAEVRTELFVLADSYADLGGGWTAENRSFDGYGYSVWGQPGDDPAELYAQLLGEVGGSQANMLVAWSGPYTDSVAGDTFLTRYDTVVAPATNATDAVFTPNGDTATQVRTMIGIPEEETSAAWLLPLGLFGLWLRRRIT